MTRSRHVRTRPAAHTEPAALALSVAAALVATAIWVALTARTGVTYHLFPFVIVAGAGFLARPGGAPLRRMEAVASAAVGLAAVALGWVALVALHETPSATFVTDQPGGVPGEVAVIAALGAVFALWWTTRPRSAD